MIRMQNCVDETVRGAVVETSVVTPATADEAALPTFGRPAEPPLSRLFTLRRVADKVGRKLKRLTGKPDVAPWVVRPRGARAQGTYVDFLFGLHYLSPNGTLAHVFTEAMEARGLSYMLVNQHNVEQVTRDVRRGWLRPYVYLDLGSSMDEAFATLLTAALESGIHCIDDPRLLSTWTFKAPAHERLAKAGLPVPPSVIFRHDEPDRELTAAERKMVGERVVIKPSRGFAKRGVVVGVEPTKQNIAAARDFDRSDDWLVQRKVSWTRYGERSAYVRAYNVCGHRSMLWWNNDHGKDQYDLLSWADVRRYDLLPALEITDRIAALSGMEFFSSEIAITEGSGPERFVLIDYINDQCDMDADVRTHVVSIPEQWVRWATGRLADFTLRKKHGIPENAEQKTLTLF